MVLAAAALAPFAGRAPWPGPAGAAEGERAAAPALLVPPPPYLQAKSAALVDLETGRLLFAQAAFERHPPGSLAKVAAALTALAGAHPGEAARIGLPAAPASGGENGGPGGPRVPGPAGEEELTLGDLVRLMLYRRDPGAAAALALHRSGSEAAFAAEMNRTVQRLGATGTLLYDPEGADPRNRSTAFDLALIAREAMRHAYFAQVAGAVRARLTRQGQSRVIVNVNSFLSRRPGATGVKSDYTPEVGYSLIAAEERGGRRLLAVIVGAPGPTERLHDAVGVLEYGFAHLEALRSEPQVPRERYVVREGDTLTGVANRFHVPVAAILNLNPIDDPDHLRAGEVLWIPR